MGTEKLSDNSKAGLFDELFAMKNVSQGRDRRSWAIYGGRFFARFPSE